MKRVKYIWAGMLIYAGIKSKFLVFELSAGRMDGISL